MAAIVDKVIFIIAQSGFSGLPLPGTYSEYITIL